MGFPIHMLCAFLASHILAICPPQRPWFCYRNSAHQYSLLTCYN